ncbi:MULTISPECIES: putative holin-like toxin [Leuconostoc]
MFVLALIALVVELIKNSNKK